MKPSERCLFADGVSVLWVGGRGREVVGCTAWTLFCDVRPRPLSRVFPRSPSEQVDTVGCSLSWPVNRPNRPVALGSAGSQPFKGSPHSDSAQPSAFSARPLLGAVGRWIQLPWRRVNPSEALQGRSTCACKQREVDVEGESRASADQRFAH